MGESDQSECDYRWLAYELHDGLLQWMVSAHMSLESVLNATDLSPTLRERVEQVTRLLECGLEEGRDLITFLEATKVQPVIDVCTALHEFLDRTAPEVDANGQKLVVHCPEPDWPEMPPENAWNLMRIAQQGIRNAMRHAGPCTITVRAGWTEDGKMKLEIRDDGRGFDPTQVDSSRHFGLNGLRHRASLLRADLSIESARGQGTCVQLIMDPDKVTQPKQQSEP